MREAAKARLSAVRRVLRSEVDLVERTYYSPLPRLDELPPSTWSTPSPLHGVRFDEPAMLALAAELAPLAADFAVPPPFTLRNGYYEAGDAESLWAMVRRLRPRRVVELGSGWSTLVIAAALEDDAVHDVYDPYPRVPGVRVTAERRAQDLGDDVFAALGENDVLFVDTSHTVKTGGDVNRIVLDVLPRLADGVHVHFHDVLLPWEPHRTWLERGWFWTEQYLVQAFLAGNPDWEVVLALHHLTRTAPDAVRTLAPPWTGDTHPSAFWIRRRRRSASA